LLRERERTIPHFSVLPGMRQALHESLLYCRVLLSSNHIFSILAYVSAHPGNCIIGSKMPFAACLDVPP